MSLPRVYVETTIPSTYFERRTTADVVARREWTRQWWESAQDRYELVSSLAVLDEVQRGDPAGADERSSLIRSLPMLSIDAAVLEVVDVYVKRKLMPAAPGGDPCIWPSHRTTGATSW